MELYRRKFRSVYICSNLTEMHVHPRRTEAKFVNFVSPAEQKSLGLNLLFFVENVFFFRELVERSIVSTTIEFVILRVARKKHWPTVGHGVNGSVPRSRCNAWTVCRASIVAPLAHEIPKRKARGPHFTVYQGISH